MHYFGGFILLVVSCRKTMIGAKYFYSHSPLCHVWCIVYFTSHILAFALKYMMYRFNTMCSV